jgi:hypothetical protein
MKDPFISAVSDYHEFKNVIRNFADAGIKLKYIEVGCGVTELWGGPYDGYHAVFYTGSKERTEVKKMIKEWKKYFESEEYA